jgi:hypothetical protein
VNVARLFLERAEEADQLGHARLINVFSPPLARSEDSKEKSVKARLKPRQSWVDASLLEHRPAWS